MQTMYEAHGLKKWYGGKPALNGVEFAVQPGRLVGLLGPNGAGKTTLLKISAGLLTPSAGEVRIAGQLPGPATKAVVSYLPDRMALPREQRAEDMVAFYKDFYTDFDGYKAGQMLADLKLDPRQRIGAMSKGTQEKLQLCPDYGELEQALIRQAPTEGTVAIFFELYAKPIAMGLRKALAKHEEVQA